MAEEKFNKHTLFQIVKHMKYNPYYVLYKLDEYLYKYHTDYYAYTYYIKVLIDLGYFTEAYSAIEFVEAVFSNQLDDNFVFSKVRLFMYTGRYDEALKLYNENRETLLFNDPRVKIIETIHSKVSDGTVFSNDFSKSYLYNQIVNYDYNSFVSHIEKHTADYNFDIDNPNPVVFAPDFPLNDVLDEINRIIPSDKRTYFSLFYNFYVFKYDGNGRVDNKLVDYFRVVTFHDTDEMITMYPMVHGEALPYTDLNYLNKETFDVKVLSRVDKFNQKYSNFLK